MVGRVGVALARMTGKQRVGQRAISMKSGHRLSRRRSHLMSRCVAPKQAVRTSLRTPMQLAPQAGAMEQIATGTPTLQGSTPDGSMQRPGTNMAMAAQPYSSSAVPWTFQPANLQATVRHQLHRLRFWMHLRRHIQRCCIGHFQTGPPQLSTRLHTKLSLLTAEKQCSQTWTTLGGTEIHGQAHREDPLE